MASHYIIHISAEIATSYVCEHMHTLTTITVNTFQLILSMITLCILTQMHALHTSFDVATVFAYVAIANLNRRWRTI